MGKLLLKVINKIDNFFNYLTPNNDGSIIM